MSSSSVLAPCGMPVGDDAAEIAALVASLKLRRRDCRDVAGDGSVLLALSAGRVRPLCLIISMRASSVRVVCSLVIWQPNTKEEPNCFLILLSSFHYQIVKQRTFCFCW